MRPLRILGLACLAALLAAAPAPAATAVPRGSGLVTLLRDHFARVAPGGWANQVQFVRGKRPLTGEPTVLPVLERRTVRGRLWLRVLLPGRPNGHSGWILASGTHYEWSKLRIVISLHRRRALIYRRGRLLRSYRVVVGKPSTPTPPGDFFIEESIRQPPGEVGGPYALALSARSNVYSEFAGGPGQIAMHGRQGLAGALGTAASHGCIRFSTAAITWLARLVQPGVPVTIRP
jgi:hypothetical protein